MRLTNCRACEAQDGDSCEGSPATCKSARESALSAGIPLSVILGKTTLHDHFSEEYIDAQCGRTNNAPAGAKEQPMSEVVSQEVVLDTLIDAVFNQPDASHTPEFEQLCNRGIDVFQRVDELREQLAAQRKLLESFLNALGDIVCEEKIKRAMYDATNQALSHLNGALAELGE